MKKIILMQDKIDPKFPEDFDRKRTELLVFKNCIFKTERLFGYEPDYFTRLQFESCIFNGQITFSGTGFKNGFTINNCIFTSNQLTSISSISANKDSIKITNNIFKAFFDFSDNFPDAPIIIKNNIFVSDTNLFDPHDLSLDVREVDCVENNIGKLDEPVSQHYLSKKEDN